MMSFISLVCCAANVSIMGVQYPLYTHVHHGYGLNDAFDRSVTLLLESAQERPDQAPSREPPFTAGEERGAPDPPDPNRNPDAMKSFQIRDDSGGGRAPRGLLQAEDIASFGADDAVSFGSDIRQSSSRGNFGGGVTGPWRSLLEADAGAARRDRSGRPAMEDSLGTSGQLSGGPALDWQRLELHEATADGEPALNSSAGVEGAAAGEFRKGAGVTKVVGGVGERLERRRLTEPHVVEHPCLHKGYSSTYRRMVSHGRLPKPAMVQLVGR